jgi:protein-L-isoaspartate O-methyltransferase
VLDDRVLDAMRRTPREFFVTRSVRPIRVADADSSTAGLGQHMLAAEILGRSFRRWTRAGMRALWSARGKGLRAGVLFGLGASVRHRDPCRARAARGNLKRAGFWQVDVVTGDTST